MNPAISVELYFFLTSILWGGIVLLAYDVLRILRRLIKHDTFFIAIEDLIFWVIASLFIFAMIYHRNNGIIRGFSVMGMLLGGILYHFSVSELLVNLIAKLIRVLLSPIMMALKKIKYFLRFIRLRSCKIINSLLFRLKKNLKSVKITLKNRKNNQDSTEKPKTKPSKRKKKTKTKREKSKTPSTEEERDKLKAGIEKGNRLIAFKKRKV